MSTTWRKYAVNGLKDGITIEGHWGTWYVIGDSVFKGEIVLLLEHEVYGDEVAALIVKRDGTIVLEEVWNGFSDLYD